MFPIKKHVVPKPRHGLKSAAIARALGTHVVPPVVELCQVVGIRAIFELETREETVQQIAARRRQIEVALLAEEEVRSL